MRTLEAFAPAGELEQRLVLVENYLAAARGGYLDEVHRLTPELHATYRGVADDYVDQAEKTRMLLDRGLKGGVGSVFPGIRAISRLRDLHNLPLDLVTGYEGAAGAELAIPPEEARLVTGKVIFSLDNCGGGGRKHVASRLGFIYKQLKFEKQFPKATRTNDLMRDIGAVSPLVYGFRHRLVERKLNSLENVATVEKL